MLAFNAVMVGLTVNPVDLYEPPDPYYLMWLGVLIDELVAQRRREQAEMESRMKR